jgi:hypothetical protein
MPLLGSLDALKTAYGHFRRRRDYKSLPLVGAVVATEVTYGGNGWHPHLHVLMVLASSGEAAIGTVGALAAGWLTSLAAVGLSGNEAAFQVQGASAAGQYVAKFGAAEEIALHGQKQGRKGGRSPWQLLDDARDGDAQAARLWQEYAVAFKGRRQLVWSRGLKARFGVGETDDEAAAAEPVPEPETVRSWLGSGDLWRAARRRRASLLIAAAEGSDLDKAEFGPTDAALWLRLGAGLVIEPD